MNGKDTNKLRWVKKVAISMAFLGLFRAHCFAGLGLPPIILVQPLGLSVQKGGTALITTTVLSLTSTTFTWYFNGKPIPNPTLLSSNGIAGFINTLSKT